MIGNVKEFGAKFEMSSLGYGERFENREIPDLEPWPKNRIAPRVAERSERRIDKRARVKECSREAVRAVIGVSDDIGHLQTIGVGETSVGIDWREPVARGYRRDTGDLPAADNLLHRAGCAGE